MKKVSSGHSRSRWPQDHEYQINNFVSTQKNITQQRVREKPTCCKINTRKISLQIRVEFFFYIFFPFRFFHIKMFSFQFFFDITQMNDGEKEENFRVCIWMLFPWFWLSGVFLGRELWGSFVRDVLGGSKKLVMSKTIIRVWRRLWGFNPSISFKIWDEL